MDSLQSEAFDIGRRTGHTEAVCAVYGVLEKYKGPEHHDVWMALMEAVEAIQTARDKPSS